MTDLPQGWAPATVGDTGDYINGLAFKPEDWETEGRPIIRIQNLSDFAKPYNRTTRKVDSRYIVKDGDILVSWSATLDAFLWRGEEAVLNQHIFRVVPDERVVDRDFLFHRLRDAIREMIDTEHLHGSTMKHINRGPFLAHGIALPPLPEQRRIVTKIDGLSGKSKRARGHLDHVPRLVERYKQAVLGAIYREIGNRRPLLELVDKSRGIPYGIIQTGKQYDGGVPTVRCGDIKGFNVNISSLKRVEPAIEQNYVRTRLRGGEVLLAIRGSVGEVCVASHDMRGFNISREVAMIPVLETVLPSFVMYYLASPDAQSHINRNVKGVAQQGINLRDVRELPTPFLPLSEQVAVVNRVETAFAWIDRLAVEATSARKLIDHLNQAILSKAFRGELVQQDPNDEPATVLLERIRGERENAEPRKRGRPRARTGAD